MADLLPIVQPGFLGCCEVLEAPVLPLLPALMLRHGLQDARAGLLTAMRADSATISTTIVLVGWMATPAAPSATPTVFAMSCSTLTLRHPTAPSSAKTLTNPLPHLHEQHAQRRTECDCEQPSTNKAFLRDPAPLHEQVRHATLHRVFSHAGGVETAQELHDLKGGAALPPLAGANHVPRSGKPPGDAAKEAMEPHASSSLS